jgi:putative oxidoreductase
MNAAVWVVQVVLAIMFGLVGFMKAFLPLDQISTTMRWVPDVPPWVVRFAGFAELAGAMGLLLPSLTRVQPRLTPLASIGLAIVVLLGAGLHFSRGEPALTPLNFVLAALAVFVAWARTRRVPIAGRP